MPGRQEREVINSANFVRRARNALRDQSLRNRRLAMKKFLGMALLNFFNHGQRTPLTTISHNSEKLLKNSPK